MRPRRPAARGRSLGWGLLHAAAPRQRGALRRAARPGRPRHCAPGMYCSLHQAALRRAVGARGHGRRRGLGGRLRLPRRGPGAAQRGRAGGTDPRAPTGGSGADRAPPGRGRVGRPLAHAVLAPGPRPRPRDWSGAGPPPGGGACARAPRCSRPGAPRARSFGRVRDGGPHGRGLRSATACRGWASGKGPAPVAHGGAGLRARRPRSRRVGLPRRTAARLP